MSLLASFDWSAIWDNRGLLAEGLWRTIQVSVIGIVLATAIGLVLGAIRAYRIPVLSQLGGVYVEIIRNTPILVQIIFLFFALPTIHAIHLGVADIHLGNAAVLAVRHGLHRRRHLGRRVQHGELPRRLRGRPVPLPGGCRRARLRTARNVLPRDVPDRQPDRAAVDDQHAHLGPQEHVADVRDRLPGVEHDGEIDLGPELPGRRDARHRRRDVSRDRLDALRARSGCSSGVSPFRRRDEPQVGSHHHVGDARRLPGDRDPVVRGLVPDAARVVGSRAALHDPHGPEGDRCGWPCSPCSARR